MEEKPVLAIVTQVSLSRRQCEIVSGEQGLGRWCLGVECANTEPSAHSWAVPRRSSTV